MTCTANKTYLDKRIVLFTANVNGGIVQLAVQLLKELTMMGLAVNCFIPDSAQYNCDIQFTPQVVPYKKVNAIWKSDRRVKAIAHQIEEAGLNHGSITIEEMSVETYGVDYQEPEIMN